jgi:hypothetical protein
VGIAHRDDRDVDRRAVAELDRPEREPAVAPLRREPRGVEGNVRRIEIGRSHVDGDAAVALLAQLEAAVHRVDDDGALVGEAALANEADEAARAVAALLDLVAAAAVEDAIAEVGAGARRRLDDEDLVGADAEAPVGDALELRAVERERLLRRVDDDEVVAGSLHLGEANAHGAIIDARSGGLSDKATARPAVAS